MKRFCKLFEMRWLNQRSGFLPGDAHDNRRLSTRLSSDRVIENRSANAVSIADDDDEKNWSKTLHYCTLFDFLSSLCLHRCLIVQFWLSFSLSFSLFVSLCPPLFLFCHTFLSFYFDYNQLKYSCCRHYTTQTIDPTTRCTLSLLTQLTLFDLFFFSLGFLLVVNCRRKRNASLHLSHWNC